ncbi:MAG: lipid II:glycine glycyltransferase FemX [Candidatus Limnocylindrales bacterium]
MSGPLEVASVGDRPTPDWDARTVDVPGGHVLQSVVWADHAVSEGWRPRFATFTDGTAALLLVRPQRPLPGFLVYASRGPVGGPGGPEAAARRAVALGHWAREAGATILAVDPELPDDAGYEATLARAGFVPAEEIQPSRHRLEVTWVPGTTEVALRGGLSKTTRQRLRAAESGGNVVREDAAGERLAELGRLLDATALRKGFTFSSRQGFLAWWQALLRAGRGRFLVAEAGGQLLGGLILYRQGGHLATAFSADDPTTRARYAGTMQLLRWTAMTLALHEGMTSLDLGGVDVAGARRRPEPGEATWGLYEHKVGFGARWVESAGAHELVLRRAVYRASLLGRSVRRAARGTRRHR